MEGNEQIWLMEERRVAPKEHEPYLSARSWLNDDGDLFYRCCFISFRIITLICAELPKNNQTQPDSRCGLDVGRLMRMGANTRSWHWSALVAADCWPGDKCDYLSWRCRRNCGTYRSF